MRVLVTETLSEQGLELLRRDFEVDVRPELAKGDLAAAIAPYDALIIRSATRVTADVLEAASSLKVIARAGIGLDRGSCVTPNRSTRCSAPIDLPSCRTRPIDNSALGPVAAEGPIAAGRSLAVDRQIHTFGTPFFIHSEGLTTTRWRRTLCPPKALLALNGFGHRRAEPRRYLHRFRSCRRRPRRATSQHHQFFLVPKTAAQRYRHKAKDSPSAARTAFFGARWHEVPGPYRAGCRNWKP